MSGMAYGLQIRGREWPLPMLYASRQDALTARDVLPAKHYGNLLVDVVIVQWQAIDEEPVPETNGANSP